MSAALALNNVYKHYSNFDMENLNLSLATGEVMGLVGANGAGKSTILRMLMGLIRADQGEVSVCGYALPEAQAAAKGEVGLYDRDDS